MDVPSVSQGQGQTWIGETMSNQGGKMAEDDGVVATTTTDTGRRRNHQSSHQSAEDKKIAEIRGKVEEFLTGPRSPIAEELRLKTSPGLTDTDLLYALKHFSLMIADETGLRHGEDVAMLWKHLDRQQRQK